MTIRSREYIKSRFETGDKPTEQDYADLIDSLLHVLEDADKLGLMEHSPANVYRSGQVVLKDGKFYKSLVNNNQGAWDLEHWGLVVDPLAFANQSDLEEVQGQVDEVINSLSGVVLAVEGLGDEVDQLKTNIENIPVVYTHTQQFTYFGETVEIQGIEYPSVELNHDVINIISAHIDHAYVYSDEYILDDQAVAFRFDNLVEGDVIEVVYTSNSKPSVFDSAIIHLVEEGFNNPYDGISQYKDVGNSTILNEYTLHVEFTGHSVSDSSILGVTILSGPGSHSVFAFIAESQLHVGAAKVNLVQYSTLFYPDTKYIITIVVLSSGASVYVNGELKLTGSFPPLGAARLPDSLFFAAFNNEGSPVSFANCSGHRLAIFDRALSPEELQQLFEEVQS